MRPNVMKRLILAVFSVASVVFVINASAFAPPVVPNPVLFLTGQERYRSGGKEFIRYNYAVMNADSYPAEMFAASPELPPCGANKRFSRTWIDIFDQRGKRLWGFCALGKPADLNGLWFGLDADEIPPSYIYIEMNDRKTNTKYKSNLADTTL